MSRFRFLQVQGEVERLTCRTAVTAEEELQDHVITPDSSLDCTEQFTIYSLSSSCFLLPYCTHIKMLRARGCVTVQATRGLLASALPASPAAVTTARCAVKARRVHSGVPSAQTDRVSPPYSSFHRPCLSNLLSGPRSGNYHPTPLLYWHKARSRTLSPNILVLIPSLPTRQVRGHQDWWGCAGSTG